MCGARLCPGTCPARGRRGPSAILIGLPSCGAAAAPWPRAGRPTDGRACHGSSASGRANDGSTPQASPFVPANPDGRPGRSGGPWTRLLPDRLSCCGTGDSTHVLAGTHHHPSGPRGLATQTRGRPLPSLGRPPEAAPLSWRDKDGARPACPTYRPSLLRRAHRPGQPSLPAPRLSAVDTAEGGVGTWDRHGVGRWRPRLRRRSSKNRTWGVRRRRLSQPPPAPHRG